MKSRILSSTILVIFLITQVTWSFNNCPTCLSRSLPTFEQTSSAHSCCGVQKESTATSCSSCSGECRCSSLETYDDIEGVASAVFSVDTQNYEIEYTLPFVQCLSELLKLNTNQITIADSPPPQNPLTFFLIFKTNVLLN